MTEFEQPDDWTEPGAWPVRTGVHRIPLRLPGSELHAVNGYLIEDVRGPVLVDPGWDRPDTLLLPAHGPVTHSVHVRVDELLAHHARRLEAAAAEVRVGRSTALEVARALPWTRRARKFDDLEPSSRMLAVLEIAAHLDLLVDQAVLTAGEQDGVRVYAS